VGKGKEELKALVRSLETGFHSAGIPQQKKESSLFQHPHLTIGRWDDISVKPIQVLIYSLSFSLPICVCQRSFRI
jgi:2'-5' RNA ligase